MQEQDSRKIAEEVKFERKRGRPSIKVIDKVESVGIATPKVMVDAPKSIGSFESAPAVQDEKILKQFKFTPLDSQYKGWVELTPEEAEELGLAGKLLGHHPGLKIGLLVPGYVRE